MPAAQWSGRSAPSLRPQPRASTECACGSIRARSARKARLENLKFTPRWNFLPVHDGNLRFLRGAAPIPIALEQRFEQLGAQRVGLHFVFPGELTHHREFVENFSERFRVTWAGG